MIEAALPDAAYWTGEQARAFLGNVGARTFQRWRVRHYKVRGLVRYRREDLEAFMEQHAVDIVRPQRRGLPPPTRTKPKGSGASGAADVIADMLRSVRN
jgi:hypothetical protein